MGKEIKHDFSQEETNTSPIDTNRVVDMKSHIKQDTSKGIADIPSSIRQFAEETLGILREKMGMIYDIEEHTIGDMHGNITYHIYKKGTILRGQGPILLIIRNDCKITIRLNPSKEEDLQSFYYSGEGLDKQDFIKEIDNMKSFLLHETISSTSKIKKESYF